MLQASSISFATVIALCVVLAVMFISTVRNSGNNESDSDKLRWTLIAVCLVAVWLGVSALVAKSGLLLQFNRMPPPFVLLAVSFTFATTVLGLSSLGTRLVKGAGIAWLMAFQGFRIPVELWLHRLYQEGVIPVQMTYSGRNFDIVSGILGLALGLWAMKAEPPRWAIWLFNLVGLGLLINIVTVAILSSPIPFRQFFNEPANTFVAYWPYVWLPAFLVQAAWFGHLLVFRWLRLRKHLINN